MGQNGAGKSSIIKLLNGMLQVNTSSSLFLFLFMFLLCFFVLFY
jgi:ABC-type multidrug transport system ATPase subunit